MFYFYVHRYSDQYLITDINKIIFIIRSNRKKLKIFLLCVLWQRFLRQWKAFAVTSINGIVKEMTNKNIGSAQVLRMSSLNYFIFVDYYSFNIYSVILLILHSLCTFYTRLSHPRRKNSVVNVTPWLLAL